MNIDLVKTFNEGKFTQGSATLKIKYKNSKVLIVQHIPVKERENECEIKGMRNAYIIDTLISVDIQKIVKNDGKVIEIYEGVFYRETSTVSPFKKVIDKLFEFRQKCKDENYDVMQMLVKLNMNSLYGE